MNPAKPAYASRRIIGCLMLLAYLLALPGIAPLALMGLAAAGDHDHHAEITMDGGGMKLVLHHHDDAHEHTSQSHGHDALPQFTAPATGDDHTDHVIGLSTSSVLHKLACANSLSLTAQDFTSSWETALPAPVWPREDRCGSSWARSPSSDPARMTCLRTTVILV